VEVAARIEREGRRVQMLSATLTDGNTELCRATAWRMRIADLDLGEQPPLEVPFAGPAGQSRTRPRATTRVSSHRC